MRYPLLFNVSNEIQDQGGVILAKSVDRDFGKRVVEFMNALFESPGREPGFPSPPYGLKGNGSLKVVVDGIDREVVAGEILFTGKPASEGVKAVIDAKPESLILNGKHEDQLTNIDSKTLKKLLKKQLRVERLAKKAAKHKMAAGI